MEKENDKTEVEKTEVKIDDAKSIAQEMAKTIVDAIKEQKDAEAKIVPDKVIKSMPRITIKDSPVGAFKSNHDMETFAKAYVPKDLIEKFRNEKALTTYANIGTAADGGSLDPIDAKGILAESIALYPSYVEDTLNVPIYNSVGTFVDVTGTTTAYMTDEVAAITESKAAYTTRTITQKKIACIAPISNEVFRFGTLADIASQTLQSCARAISEKKQWLIFQADGTADTLDGGLTGLIPAINAVANNSTEYVKSGTWSDLDVTDIASIVAMVSDWGNPANFSWYAHKNMWGVLEGISRALGTSYMVNVGQRPIPSLFGYPVKFVNKMASSASGDSITSELLFGDLSGAIATGSDGNVYIDSSDGFYFQNDLTTLRVIEHFGEVVYQPGTNGTTTSVVGVNFSSAS